MILEYRSELTPTMIQEKYSNVFSDADRNFLRQKAATHTLGRALTLKELSDLKFSREYLGNDYFNRYHPNIHYQSLYLPDNIVEDFGTGTQRARIHYHLHKPSAIIQFFSNKK